MKFMAYFEPITSKFQSTLPLTSSSSPSQFNASFFLLSLRPQFRFSSFSSSARSESESAFRSFVASPVLIFLKMLKFCRPSKRKSTTTPSDDGDGKSPDGFAGTSRRRVLTTSSESDLQQDEGDDDDDNGEGGFKYFLRRQSARFRKRITAVKPAGSQSSAVNLLKR